MGKNDALISDINKYCQPNSILIIDAKRKLIRLYCPFKVMAICDIHYLKAADLLEVVAVKISDELLMLYVIRQVAYPYYCFIILDQAAEWSISDHAGT